MKLKPMLHSRGPREFPIFHVVAYTMLGASMKLKENKKLSLLHHHHESASPYTIKNYSLLLLVSWLNWRHNDSGRHELLQVSRIKKGDVGNTFWILAHLGDTKYDKFRVSNLLLNYVPSNPTRLSCHYHVFPQRLPSDVYRSHRRLGPTCWIVPRSRIDPRTSPYMVHGYEGSSIAMGRNKAPIKYTLENDSQSSDLNLHYRSDTYSTPGNFTLYNPHSIIVASFAL